jgi:hypothetical protein
MPPVVRPHVRVQVGKGIKFTELEGLLRSIVELQPGGCRTCGLTGFDFSIVVNPDPTLGKKLNGVPGVTGVTIGS